MRSLISPRKPAIADCFHFPSPLASPPAFPAPRLQTATASARCRPAAAPAQKSKRPLPLPRTAIPLRNTRCYKHVSQYPQAIPQGHSARGPSAKPPVCSPLPPLLSSANLARTPLAPRVSARLLPPQSSRAPPVPWDTPLSCASIQQSTRFFARSAAAPP